MQAQGATRKAHKIRARGWRGRWNWGRPHPPLVARTSGPQALAGRVHCTRRGFERYTNGVTGVVPPGEILKQLESLLTPWHPSLNHQVRTPRSISVHSTEPPPLPSYPLFCSTWYWTSRKCIDTFAVPRLGPLESGPANFVVPAWALMEVSLSIVAVIKINIRR